MLPVAQFSLRGENVKMWLKSCCKDIFYLIDECILTTISCSFVVISKHLNILRDFFASYAYEKNAYLRGGIIKIIYMFDILISKLCQSLFRIYKTII